MPSRTEGQYIWSCVKTVKYVKDPDTPTTLTEQTTYSNPVRLSGVDGKDGEKGDPGIGVKKVIDLFKIVDIHITDVKNVPTPTNDEYSEKIEWTNDWLTSPDGRELAKDQVW